MDSKDNFSKEYISDLGTKKQDSPEIPLSQDLSIDIEKYGISKPRRLVLRSKIIHDKDKKRKKE